MSLLFVVTNEGSSGDDSLFVYSIGDSGNPTLLRSGRIVPGTNALGTIQRGGRISQDNQFAFVCHDAVDISGNKGFSAIRLDDLTNVAQGSSNTGGTNDVSPSSDNSLIWSCRGVRFVELRSFNGNSFGAAQNKQFLGRDSVATFNDGNFCVSAWGGDGFLLENIDGSISEVNTFNPFATVRPRNIALSHDEKFAAIRSDNSSEGRVEIYSVNQAQLSLIDFGLVDQNDDFVRPHWSPDDSLVFMADKYFSFDGTTLSQQGTFQGHLYVARNDSGSLVVTGGFSSGNPNQQKISIRSGLDFSELATLSFSEDVSWFEFLTDGEGPVTPPIDPLESRFGDGTNWALFKDFDASIGPTGGWESFTDTEASPADADVFQSYQVELRFDDGNLFVFDGISTIGRLKGTLEVDVKETQWPSLPAPTRAIRTGSVFVRDTDDNEALVAGDAISDLFWSRQDNGAPGTIVTPFDINVAGQGLSNVPNFIRFTLESTFTSETGQTIQDPQNNDASQGTDFWTDVEGTLEVEDGRFTGDDSEDLNIAAQTLPIPAELLNSVDDGTAQYRIEWDQSASASGVSAGIALDFLEADGTELSGDFSIFPQQLDEETRRLETVNIPPGAREVRLELVFSRINSLNHAKISPIFVRYITPEESAYVDALRVRIYDFEVGEDDPPPPDPDDPPPDDDPPSDEDEEFRLDIELGRLDATDPKITALRTKPDVQKNANQMVSNLADFQNEYTIDAIIPLGQRSQFKTIDDNGNLNYFFMRKDRPGFRQGVVGILTDFNARSAIDTVPVTLTFRGKSGNFSEPEPPPEPEGPQPSPEPEPGPMTITSVSPNAVSESGGRIVTVTGTGFRPSAPKTITVGAFAQNTVFGISETELKFAAPAGTGQDLDVTVENDGREATLAGVFNYGDLELVSLSPNSGPAAGGTSITLTVKNLDTTTPVNVAIDQVLATNIVTVDSETVTCDTPAGTAGTVDVSISEVNSGRFDVLVDGWTYT